MKDGEQGAKCGGRPAWVEELAAFADDEREALSQLEAVFSCWRNTEVELDDGTRTRMWNRVAAAPPPPVVADAPDSDRSAHGV